MEDSIKSHDDNNFLFLRSLCRTSSRCCSRGSPGGWILISF